MNLDLNLDLGFRRRPLAAGDHGGARPSAFCLRPTTRGAASSRHRPLPGHARASRLVTRAASPCLPPRIGGRHPSTQGRHGVALRLRAGRSEHHQLLWQLPRHLLHAATWGLRAVLFMFTPCIFLSIGSLNHRWTSIAECCSRWAGCVSSVERQYSSGTTMQDRLNSTQELYQLREPKNRPFVMLHCWSLLQHNQKWINRNAETHPTKKNATPDLNSEAYDDMSGQSTTQSSNWETNERPPGRKKEKERRKNGEDTSGFETAIQDMVKAKKEIESEKKVDKQERWEKLMSLQERQMEQSHRQKDETRV